MDYERFVRVPDRPQPPSTPVVRLPPRREEPKRRTWSVSVPASATTEERRRLGRIKAVETKMKKVMVRWEKLRELYVNNPGAYSLPELAYLCGFKCHSSVLHALKQMGVYSREAQAARIERQVQHTAERNRRERLEREAAGAYTRKLPHPGIKLNSESARRLKRMIAAGVPLKEIAAHFGLTQGYVSSIKSGRYWGHIE